MKKIIVTSIYREFWGTDQFKKSLVDLKLPFHNAWKGEGFTGNGTAMKHIYEAYKELRSQYDYAIYSDGADTYFVKDFEPPKDKILYSAEKACYPYPWLAERYPKATTLKDGNESPWKYFNAGNCSGPIDLLIEFYEKYKLTEYDNKDINGQLELTHAYLDAIKDGFPIELDTHCDYFQTIAFTDPGEFVTIVDSEKKIKNTRTDTYPFVFHGNGRTDMRWIYNLYK